MKLEQPLPGYVVDSITVSIGGTTVRLRPPRSDGDLAQVLIEGDYKIHGGEPENWRKPGGDLAELKGREVMEFRVGERGEGELLFRDGIRLTAYPDVHYESWEFHGPGTLHWICLPGGEVTSVGAPSG